MYHHKYSLSEVLDLIPWEREVYVSMVIQEVKEQTDRLKNQR